MGNMTSTLCPERADATRGLCDVLLQSDGEGLLGRVAAALAAGADPNGIYNCLDDVGSLFSLAADRADGPDFAPVVLAFLDAGASLRDTSRSELLREWSMGMTIMSIADADERARKLAELTADPALNEPSLSAPSERHALASGGWILKLALVRSGPDAFFALRPRIALDVRARERLLEYVVQTEEVAVVADLLGDDLAPDACLESGNTLLALAVKSTSPAMVPFLLERCSTHNRPAVTMAAKG